MKERYFYSAETNSFYPFSLFEDYKLANSLPVDLKEVSEEVFNEFTSVRKCFMRHSKNGYPCWIESPPTSFHEYKNGKWIITEEKQAELDVLENQRKIQQLQDDLETLERDISRLERIRDRNEDEEAKLQQLYDESTQLYRDIQAIEND